MNRAKKRPGGLILSLAILWGWVAPISSGAESVEGRRKVETNLYSIELASAGECCPSQLALVVQDRTSGQDRTLRAAARIEELSKLVVVEDHRLLIWGRLRYGGEILLVVDLQENRVVDELWAYFPVISPSGRFIAYRSHYPRMGIPEARRSIVLVYDLGAPPAQNRAGVQRELSRSNAGLPVFPEANAEAGLYTLTLEPEQLYLSPFLWSASEDRLVFLERGSTEPELVVVDLKTGLDKAKIRRIPVDKRLFLTRSALDQLDDGQIEDLRINLESLTWASEKEDEVALVPYADFQLRPSLRISVPPRPR